MESHCSHQNLFYNSSWSSVIRNVSRLNQFLVVSIIPEKVQHNDGEIQFYISYNYTIYEYDEFSEEPASVIESEETKEIALSCAQKNQECAPHNLIVLGQLDYKDYLVEMNFSGLENDNIYVESFEFQASVVDKSFTVYILILRYICVGLSAVSLIVYTVFLSKIKKISRIWEQRMIFIGGLLLILYNDPLIGFAIIYPNLIS